MGPSDANYGWESKKKVIPTDKKEQRPSSVSSREVVLLSRKEERRTSTPRVFLNTNWTDRMSRMQSRASAWDQVTRTMDENRRKKWFLRTRRNSVPHSFPREKSSSSQAHTCKTNVHKSNSFKKTSSNKKNYNVYVSIILYLDACIFLSFRITLYELCNLLHLWVFIQWDQIFHFRSRCHNQISSVYVVVVSKLPNPSKNRIWIPNLIMLPPPNTIWDAPLLIIIVPRHKKHFVCVHVIIS